LQGVKTLYPPSRYKAIGKDIIARWNAGEPERMERRAAINAQFDIIRDKALAKLWGDDK